jgi:CRP/FNR family transcriptional regulator, anaerobic regulatory protein
MISNVREELVQALTGKGFTVDQAHLLAGAFSTEVFLEEDEYFIRENQVCSQLAIIRTGMFRYFYRTESDEITRWVSLEGDFMTSLSSFISRKPTPENIQALKPSVLFCLSRNSWDHLFRQHEFIREYWLRTIELNYIGMEERVFNLIARPAEARYQWMLDNYPQFNRHVPDKYLASMLGVTPRHLSRIRAQRK